MSNLYYYNYSNDSFYQAIKKQHDNITIIYINIYNSKYKYYQIKTSRRFLRYSGLKKTVITVIVIAKK